MENFTQFNLDSNICKAISLCGYEKPTPVQAKSIPEVLLGRDVAVSAQTGTGKTAAFVLPMLHLLSQQAPTKKTRVLILTPTRELAAQITKAANMYGKFMRFNIVSLVGGMPYGPQEKDLARGADIIVATPGRLMDHMEKKRVDLSNIEMLVLDEADRMLDMGFIDDVQYIAKLTPAKRQTLLFSATLDNKLMNAVKHLLKNPLRIDLSHDNIASGQIEQLMYKATSLHHKTRLLKHFLSDENIFKAIIFSATKVHADRLAAELCDEGYAAAPLHGDLRQNVRTRTLEQLRRGKVQYLVATDVAARGIDISDISHVFNYDMPRFCEDYVHRIGRTGRAGKTGIAISFVTASDMPHLKSIERYLGTRIPLQHQEIREQARKPVSDETLSLRKESLFEDDDERPRKTFREKSFRKDERGEKRFSDRKPRSDRPEGEARPYRSDRPERKFKSDRPFGKPGDASGRTEGRFASKDKPERFERKEGRFAADKDKPERFERKEGRFASKDKPERFERKEGRFASKDKPERFERKEGRFAASKDKPERFERKEGRFAADKDKPERFERKEGRFASKDKPERFERKEGRFADKDKPERSERKEGRFADKDKPERSERKEGRFADKNKSERFGKKFKSDKRESTFKSDRSDKPVKSFYSDKNEPVSSEAREGYRAKSKTSSPGNKERWSFKEKRSASKGGFQKKRRERKDRD